MKALCLFLNDSVLLVFKSFSRFSAVFPFDKFSNPAFLNSRAATIQKRLNIFVNLDSN